MELDTDNLKAQIPYYLTRPQAEGIKQALRDFSNGQSVNLYLNKYSDELLQGDCWDGFQIISYRDGQKRNVKGVVLSNTCDIAQENNRAISPKIVFAPLIPLARYQDLLEKTDINPSSISAKLETIKKQEVTNIFYLPSDPSYGLKEDSIILLDDIHSLPSEYFHQNQKKSKVYTLSMFGFYLFIFKLSIHFCRMHEQVDRF